MSNYTKSSFINQGGTDYRIDGGCADVLWSPSEWRTPKVGTVRFIGARLYYVYQTDFPFSNEIQWVAVDYKAPQPEAN